MQNKILPQEFSTVKAILVGLLLFTACVQLFCLMGQLGAILIVLVNMFENAA